MSKIELKKSSLAGAWTVGLDGVEIGDVSQDLYFTKKWRAFLLPNYEVAAAGLRTRKEAVAALVEAARTRLSTLNPYTPGPEQAPFRELAAKLLEMIPEAPRHGYWGGDAMTENCIWIVLNTAGRPWNVYLFEEEARENATREGYTVYGVPVRGIAARILAPFKLGLENAKKEQIYPYHDYLPRVNRMLAGRQ